MPEVEDFQAVFGKGIEGRVKGEVYYVGNRKFMEEKGIRPDKTQEEEMERLAEEGKTPLLFGCAHGNGRLEAVLAVADTVKESSLQAIRRLQAMHIRVIMLTGDNRKTAEAVRRKLGIAEVVAEVLPDEKEQQIRKLKGQGKKVAMIGDGVNDAPALASADVGIAIGAGTDVALESADIILMKNDLRDAVTAIRLSRAVIRNIKENLFWAFFYNSIGIPLAAGVLYPLLGLKLNPMFGAAAMSLSSVCVVGNALRLCRFKEEPKQEGGKATDAGGEVQSGGETQKEKKENKEEMKMITKTMIIDGMSCGHCTARVQKALEAVEGVAAVTMSLEEKSAVIELSGEPADDTLRDAVTQAGYEVVEIR